MNIPQDINKVISYEEVRKFIETYEEVQNYSMSLKSQLSKVSCVKDVMRFCRIFNTNPHDFLNDGANKEEKFDSSIKLLKMFCYNIENWNVLFPSKRNPLKYTVAFNISKSTRGFIRENFNWKISSKLLTLSSPKVSYTYTPTRSDLKHIREEMTKFRDKVLVDFLATVPLRRKEVLSVLWSDFDLSEEIPSFIFSSDRLKGSYEKVWFLGIINKSLKEKLKQLKELEKEKFTKRKLVWSEDLPIFMTIKFSKKHHTYMPLGYPELGALFKKAQKKVEKKYGVHVTLHSIRRYFQSRLTYAKSKGVLLPEEYEGYLTAHKLKGTKPDYTRIQACVKPIKELYKQLEPFISLDYSEQQQKENMSQIIRTGLALNKTPEEIASELSEQYKMQLLTLINNALEEEQRKTRE